MQKIGFKQHLVGQVLKQRPEMKYQEILGQDLRRQWQHSAAVPSLGSLADSKNPPFLAVIFDCTESEVF